MASRAAFEINMLTQGLQNMHICDIQARYHLEESTRNRSQSRQEDREAEVALPRGVLHDFKREAPNGFDRSSEVRMVLTFCENLCIAVKQRERTVEWGIMEQVVQLRSAVHRRIILNVGLEAAAEDDDLVLAAWVLQNEGNTILDFLEKPMYAAAKAGNVDIVRCLMERLMRDDEMDRKINAALLGVRHTHPDAEDHLWMYRASVVVRALDVAIDQDFNDIVDLLMPLFQQVIQDETGWPVLRSFREVTIGRYIEFSREQCMSLISEQRMPRILRDSIRCRLEDSEPFDIAVVADGKEFMAHRDILVFWSGMFATCYLTMVTKVPLPESVSANTMQRVYNFMYSGIYEDSESEDREQVLKDLLEAAIYMRIPKLADRVKDLLNIGLDLKDEEDEIEGLCRGLAFSVMNDDDDVDGLCRGLAYARM